MHPNSELIFKKYAERYFCNGMRILEIGPDKFPSTYQNIVGNYSLVWDTLDITNNPNLTYRSSDEYSFPIPDGTYDIVLSGQVLEHVRRIWIWIKEVSRVCKDRGFVITISPVSYIYHEAPVDCWRVYPDGMKALYMEAELEVLTSVCESLELPGFRRYIPGIPLIRRSKKRRILTLFFGRLGFPVERSYDTITIGKKQQSENRSS